MEQLFTTANLVQAGAVIIALVSIGLNYKLVANHISHNTEATTKLGDAINKLIEYLKEK